MNAGIAYALRQIREDKEIGSVCGCGDEVDGEPLPYNLRTGLNNEHCIVGSFGGGKGYAVFGFEF